MTHGRQVGRLLRTSWRTEIAMQIDPIPMGQDHVLEQAFERNRWN